MYIIFLGVSHECPDEDVTCSAVVVVVPVPVPATKLSSVMSSKQSPTQTELSSSCTTTTYGAIQHASSASIHHPSLPLGSASFISCVANLSNTILGTGMLAMAHGFAQGGLIVGIITVLLCGSMAYLGLYLLALCAAHPSIPHRTASFSAISKVTYPQASILFDLAIAIKCFGVSISYLLIFGKLIPQVILSFKSAPLISSQDDTTHWALDRRLWITLSMIILAPVSFLPTLDSLRHISYVALIGVFNLVYVVIYKFLFERPLPSSSSGAEIRWYKIDSDFLTALPLFVFAYTCAQNLFSVHNEMILNSSRQMKSVLRTCIGSAVGTYEIVGILGYLTFGSKVSSNLIADYQNSILVSITRLTVSILVLFSYPLQLYPCRTSLIKVLNHHYNESDKNKNSLIDSRISNQELEDGEENQENEDLINNAKTSDDLDIDQSHHHSVKLFTFITAFLLLASFLIAIQVERLEIILGFVGSTGSTTISYILPGLFFLKLFPENSTNNADNPNKSTISRRGRFKNSVNHNHQEITRNVDSIEDDNDDGDVDNSYISQLDSIELKILRKLALFLVVIGVFVMLVCLSLNIKQAFF